MTKDDLIKVAERVAIQEMIVRNLGMMNAYGIDAKQRVAQDARYKVEGSILERLSREYQEALARYEAEI